MAKGCHVNIVEVLYGPGQEYCRRFCEESGVQCDPPPEKPGCTKCFASDKAILHTLVSLDDCQEDPPSPYIDDGQWVYSEFVVVYGNPYVTKDTCKACAEILAHPCFGDYQDYEFDIPHQHLHVGPRIYCRCPNG